MPGSACTVAEGQSCMRMIWPFCSWLAAWRICDALALFQSWESTSQMISRRPRALSTDFSVEFVSP